MSLTSLTMSIQSNSALQNSSISEDTPLLANEVIIIAGRYNSFEFCDLHPSSKLKLTTWHNF